MRSRRRARGGTLLRGSSAPVLADGLPGGMLRDVVLASGHAAVVAGAGRISIDVPGSPVPISAQSLAALTGAIALGPARTVAGSLLHAGLGAAGVNGFAPRSRATRGYVVGLHLAALLVAQRAARGGGRTFRQAAVTTGVGHALVLAIGAAWMAYDQRLDAGTTWRQAVRPFLAGAVLKSTASGAIVSWAWRWRTAVA